ncbi:MAG: TonB-dependent receptor [Candidatus Zixiibacteriota bacterium]
MRVSSANSLGTEKVRSPSTSLRTSPRSFDFAQDKSAVRRFRKVSSSAARPESLRPRRVRVLLVLLACLSIWLYPAFVFAESNIKIEGHIYDRDDGHRVPGAIVGIAGTSYQRRADNSGYFFFEKIPTGTYSLKVSCPGYENQAVSPLNVSEDITTRIDVHLRRKTFVLPGLEVTAEKEPVRITSVETLDKQQIRRMQARTLAEVIENVSGVFVQGSGGAGGSGQVSIRGSSPEHVLVLVDGHKINPSGSGVADLNTIPLEMVERVEILKGGQSARWGADALGGVINVVTRPSKKREPLGFSLESHRGKWKSETYSSSFSNTFFEKLKAKFAGSYQYSENDFEIWVYDDPRKREILNSQGQNGDSTTTRKNAYRKASNFFVSGNYPLGSRTELDFSGQWYGSKHGLPGSYGQMLQYQRAWAEDERRFSSMKLAHAFSSGFSLDNTLSWSRFSQRFQNDTMTVFDAKYVDDLLDFSALASIRLASTNQFKIGTQFEQDVLNHTDFLHPETSMGKISRQTYSAFVSDEQHFVLPRVLLFEKLKFTFAVRWDQSKSLKDFISPQAGLSVSRGQNYRLTLRANYGKSYRQPSNNALFWKEDVFAVGNPDLLPEKSEHSEAGGEIHLPWLGNLSGGMTCFHNVVTDLIEWHRRFDGRYQPVNISRARIYGHEDFVSWKSPGDILEVNYNNTVCYAKNKSGDRVYDGKFIPFRPRYVTNLSFRFDYSVLEILYKLRWVSERFNGPANSIAQREQPYHLQNLSLGLKKKLWGVETKLRCEWRNLTDEEYEVIYRHPMPGRAWSVSIAFTREFN